MHHSQDDDEKAGSDSDSLPANLLLEATPKRGQQPMH
jgi:hypothetical protein